MNAIDQLTAVNAEYNARKTRRDNALDESGIGHDVEDRLTKAGEALALYIGEFSRRLHKQLAHELITNVPCGIRAGQMTPDKLAELVAKTALAGFAGSLVKWDINDALLLAADILEDVNAHPEASELRAKVEGGEGEGGE